MKIHCTAIWLQDYFSWTTKQKLISQALLTKWQQRTCLYVHHFLPCPKQSPQKLLSLTVTDTVPNNTCNTTLASVQTCPDNQERVCSVIIADTPTAFSRQRSNWALIISITRQNRVSVCRGGGRKRGKKRNIFRTEVK